MSKNQWDNSRLRLKQIASHIKQPLKTDYSVPHYASTTPTNRLEGKVAIITGCNSEKGIGRATALIFAASGANAVIICDLASSNLARWTKEISERYPKTIVEWKQFDASGYLLDKHSRLTLDEDAVKQVVS